MNEPVRTRMAALVSNAVAEVNADLPPGLRLRDTDEAVLLGPNREIDSLGLVMLFAAIEERVLAAFGVSLALGQEGEMAMLPTDVTLGGLTGHCAEALERLAP